MGIQLGIDKLGLMKLGKSALLSGSGLVGLLVAKEIGIVSPELAADPEVAMEWGAAMAVGITWLINIVRKFLVKYPPSASQA